MTPRSSLRSFRQLQPECGDTFVDAGAVVASDAVEQDALGMALAAIRFLLDSGHPVVFLPGRTVVCIQQDWWAFCDSCGGTPIGQFFTRAFAEAAPCLVCSEREQAARWAAVFVEQVRHAASIAQSTGDAARCVVHQSGGAL